MGVADGVVFIPPAGGTEGGLLAPIPGVIAGVGLAFGAFRASVVRCGVLSQAERARAAEAAMAERWSVFIVR